MATYAMICCGRVIEVVHNQEKAPVWPADSVGNPVTAIECSEEVNRNWTYDPVTGELSEYTPTEPDVSTETRPTQLDRIDEQLKAIADSSSTEYSEYYRIVNEALTGGESYGNS